MKKIINGKAYDTKTAKWIGEQHHDLGNFHSCEEDLYRKKTGEYFLHGAGGPMSKYAVASGQNEWSGSEQIIPLTYDEAKEWAEEYLTTEDYEQEFGIVEEGESYLTTYIPANLHKKIKIKASETGKTMSKIVEEILEKNL